MATYYCSETGTGDGSTVQNPMSPATFNTFSKWSSTANTSGKISPGDTVYFLGTIVTMCQTQQSGLNGNAVTLRGDYSVDLQGIFDGQNSASAIFRIATDYINVTGLKFKNCIYNTGFYNGSILISTHSNINISNCVFNSSIDADTISQCHIQLNAQSANVSNISVTSCTFNGPGWGFYVLKAGDFDISNITFQNNIAGNGSDRFYVTGQYNTGQVPPFNYFTVGGGIFMLSNMSSGTTGTFHDINVSNNKIQNTRYHGIKITCSIPYDWNNNLQPYNVNITDNTILNSGHAGISLITKNFGSGSLIARNYINGTGVLKKDVCNAIQIASKGALIVEHNYIQRAYTATVAGDAVGIELDRAYEGLPDTTSIISDGVIVRYNHINDCNYTNSGYPASGIEAYRAKNCQIYYNIISNCGRGISCMFNLNVGNVFYNNVISNCVYGIFITDEFPASIFKNNIITNSTYGLYVEFTANGKVDAVLPTETNNCYYNNNNLNYIDKRTGSQVPVILHATSLNKNPSLKSDYSVGRGSCCINAGANVGLTTDYKGNTVPYGSTPDIGAFEMRPAQTGPATTANIWLFDIETLEDNKI